MTAAVTKGYVGTPYGQVHVRVSGERRGASGLPIVLLHQTASSSVMYERVMSILGETHFCFAPDTPGFGGTEALGEKGSVEAYARVLLAAIERAEIDRAYVFGHHSGASIAAEIACMRPELVAKLALGGPPVLTKEQLEKLVPTVCPVKLEEDGSHLMAVWKRIRAKDPSAPLDLSHREAVLNLLAGVRYPEAYMAVFAHDLPARLRAITCPTLVFAGPDDTIRASLEPAFALLQRGTMNVLPRGGTYVCDREPELVAQLLRDFFREETSR